MEAQILGVVTSVCSVVAAIAAAYGTVKRSELDGLERRIKALEGDLDEERTSHAAARKALNEAQQSLNSLTEKYRRCLVVLARHGLLPTEK